MTEKELDNKNLTKNKSIMKKRPYLKIYKSFITR